MLLLPTGGAGYSSGIAGIAISAFGTPEAQTAVMAHELTNSIHPYGPLWWGDAGWSQLCNQRVVRAFNGKSEKVANSSNSGNICLGIISKTSAGKRPPGAVGL